MIETKRWNRERGKEKKHSENEKMKKKKKKGKEKEKDDKKSRKKKKKEERKKRKNKDKLERDLEALKKSSLPDLEQLETKLSAYYAKVEKDCAALRRLESLVDFEIYYNNFNFFIFLRFLALFNFVLWNSIYSLFEYRQLIQISGNHARPSESYILLMFLYLLGM